MNSIKTRTSIEDRVSFDGYVQRYRLNPYDAKVQESFKEYLLYKIDKIKIEEPDSNFTYVKRELNSPSLSLKRLKHLAYLVSLTQSERHMLQNMHESFSLNQRNPPNPALFARGFHQMADSASQWSLASELESNSTFKMHFEATIKMHAFYEPEKEIEKMEQDLALIPNFSLFKQYLRERKLLDAEGRLIKAETPLETKQRLECYLELLSHVLQLGIESFRAIDLKAWEEKVSSSIYNRFLVALESNPKWKKSLADVQNSKKSAAEKIEEIKGILSKQNQVQKLLQALSIKVEREDIESMLADPTLSRLGLGFPNHPNGLFLEEWQTKKTLKALYSELASELHPTSAIRSKVEDLCRAIGISASQRLSVYELYTSYLRVFKEKCAEIQNPIHLLLIKEAHLNRNTKVLEQICPKYEPSKLSPTGSNRTFNESPASEEDAGFQAFILDKGRQTRLNTPKYLRFARDLYYNPFQSPLEPNIEEWSPKAKEECFKWFSNSFFTECLDVNLESEDNSNLAALLKSFQRHAKKEIERLGLPSIYLDMLVSGLSSGNVKRLKLIADEIAYARYREVNSDKEPTSFKNKTISEKIESTKNYLKKMEDRSYAGYLLAYMESFPLLIGEISEKHQSYIDLYLRGSYTESKFCNYLKESGLNPLNIEQDKRPTYLFYLQKKFVKKLIQDALRTNFKKRGGAVLACELKATLFLDLKKLDSLARLIESGQEVTIDTCLSLDFYEAARKLFIDSLSNPSFDAVSVFNKIGKLSEQKALLEALEKSGGHDKVIYKIIMEGTTESYLAGYEWLRDRINQIPEKEFMRFFLKYFRKPIKDDDFLKVLENRSCLQKAFDEFHAAIKQPQFVNSPVRTLLENEGIIDGSGNLTWYVGLDEMFTRLELCLLTQKDFIKMNRDRVQLEKKGNFVQMQPIWIHILTEINAEMEEALKNGISLECSQQQVEELIRTAISGATGNSIFSDYLRTTKVEYIKGLSARKHYGLYVYWTNSLSRHFEEKLEYIQSPDFKTVGSEAHQVLLEGIRMQNWDKANNGAKVLLFIESVSQESPSDFLSSCVNHLFGRQQNLPPGFVQKSLQSKDASELLEKEEYQLKSKARLDQTKWIEGIKSKMDTTINWINHSCLNSLVSDINDLDLSISEKKFKIDSLMIGLSKVLTQEFERLKMSPSYKDLIERAFCDGDESLCTFLIYEAIYGNYQYERKKLREEKGGVLEIDTAERSLENEPLQTKINKLVNILRGFPEYKNLLDAIDIDRFKELIRAVIVTK